MANRKVLINRHTSGNTAPTASEMYLGEIAIAHETGKETIFTKNNAGDMVPFVSCAQTIAMINNLVEASEDDVKAGTGEQHLEVATASTGDVKTWTITTKDVASDAAFGQFSADTNENIANLTNALTALTNVVLTGISGDSIIVAEVKNPTTGTNYVALTHRTGEEASGFKKLSTDAYGHVTASTDVLTADIQALGFKTSAETGEDLAELSASVVANETHISELSAGTQHDIVALSANTHGKIVEVYGSANSYADAAIAEAILGLDSETAVTAGKYITGIAIADGKISGITQEDLPSLEVESAGTGNVVAAITVEGHKITYQTASVATSEGIAQLSAATQAISGYAASEIAQLSGATQAISGYAQAEIAQLSGATEAISGYAASQIAALSAGTLQLSADTDAAINQLSGYAASQIAALSAGTLQLSADTDAAIDALAEDLSDLSAVTLTGVSLNNTPLTVTDHVVSVPVTTSGSGIANATESGSVADALAVKEYVQNTVSSAVEYKGATDDVPAGTPVVGDLWIASSAFTVDGKNVEVGDFIIYNGEQWEVIEKNLDGAITGNLTQDTVVLGDSTNSVKSLANGASGQVLTMAGGAPAWVDDPELTVVSAGTGNVLTNITVDDHEITFTKGITAASDADLQALSGAVEDFSGATDAKFIELSAYTKDVDDKVKALSAGTIQLSADTKAAIEQLSGFAHNSMIARDDAVFSSAKTYTDEKVAAEIALLDSSTAVTTGKYITGIAIADGKISGITEESLPANVVLTATTATPVDTASAVLTGVTASGTDNHELTFGMSNKVFSASTAESAVTSQSAQTSVSANMAYELSSAATITSGQVTDLVAGIQNTKVNSATTAESADTAASADKVANALSVSGYSDSSAASLDTAFNYDGSAAQSLTFGTNGNAGLKSMSMTSAGVVDVEVIDCGEY